MEDESVNAPEPAISDWIGDVYRLHTAGLLDYASRQLGKRKEYIGSEDIVHIAYLRFLKAELTRDDFAGSEEERMGKVNGWLKHAVRYIVIEILRSVDLERPASERECYAFGERILWETASRKAFESECLQSFFAALPLLDPKDRDILERSKFLGQSATAIGKVLGMMPDAVRKARTRAVAALRQKLPPECRDLILPPE